MKKQIYVLILVILSMSSCRKAPPKPDVNEYYNEFAWAIWYTNKYVLTNINAGCYKQDTIWQKVEDTISYNNFYIKLDMGGKIISINNYYDERRSIPNYIEQKYFINKVVSFEVYPDCVYNDSISPNNQQFNKFVEILFRNEKQQYYNNSYPYYRYSELGYTPIKIKLLISPDTSKWVSFTVKITDDKNNTFTSTTNKIFITK